MTRLFLSVLRIHLEITKFSRFKQNKERLVSKAKKQATLVRRKASNIPNLSLVLFHNSPLLTFTHFLSDRNIFHSRS